eukprot:10889-Heterococcus_DN1.PRE.4
MRQLAPELGDTSMKVSGKAFRDSDIMRPVSLPFTKSTASSNKALFAHPNDPDELEDEVENSIYFVQLPTKLPDVLMDSRRPETIPPVEEAKQQQQQNKKPNMRIHESGKMVLIIGGVSLDVTAGLPCYFNSEIVAINAENKTMSMFGQVNKRMVCTPNFEDLCARQKADDAMSMKLVKDELQEVDDDDDIDVKQNNHNHNNGAMVDATIGNGLHQNDMVMDDL